MKSSCLLLFTVLPILLSNCDNPVKPGPPPVVLPTVTTSAASDITEWSVVLGGEVTSHGNDTLIERGICFSRFPSPTSDDFDDFRAGEVILPGDSGLGSFSYPFLWLAPATKYYVRAFAANNAGISYGEELTFTTLVKDMDGNLYTPVNIGTQVWLKENLRTSKYANGDIISQPGADWGFATTTIGGYCIYNDNTANQNPYGKLYNWYAVADPRKLCPTGWHVSTDADWTTLETFLGGSSIAGGKLKEAGTTHWLPPNTGADNSSGFTGLPGGNRRGADNSIYETLGTMGRHWTATEVDADAALGRDLIHNGTQVGNGIANQFNKKYGFSVRCVKD